MGPSFVTEVGSPVKPFSKKAICSELCVHGIHEAAVKNFKTQEAGRLEGE
jgi:hypothetical protein